MGSCVEELSLLKPTQMMNGHLLIFFLFGAFEKWLALMEKNIFTLVEILLNYTLEQHLVCTYTVPIYEHVSDQ